jgi:tetratricopeptide (TPR) repeat protein
MARAMASIESQDGYFKVLETASREFTDGDRDEKVNDQKIVNCSCYALFLSQLLPLEEQLGATSSDIAKLLEVQKAKTLMTLAFIRSRYLESEEECKAAYENIKRVIPSLIQLADPEVWDIVLIVVQQIEREDYRAKILYELASVLVLPMHLHTLNCVLNVAWRIQEETCRVEPLGAVAVALTTIGGQNLLSRALEIVNSFNDKNHQAEILLRISQILAESEDRQGLYQLLNVVQTLNSKIRTEVLSKIVCYLSQIGDEAGAFSTWDSQLTNLHQNERSGVFHALSAGIPFISNTDQGQTLWLLYSALNEVESWWIKPKEQKVFSSEPEKASTLIDLGLQYLQQERWTKALGCFEESLAISRQIGNQQRQALALHHIGQVYLKQEQWTEAIKYLKQDLALCHELNDIRGQAQNLSNLAVAYGGQNFQKEAIECLKQSLSLMHQLGFQEGDCANLYDLAATFHNLGGSYMQLKQWTEAINSFEQALTMYRKLGDAEEIADTLQILVDLYRKVEQESRRIVAKVTSWFQKTRQGTEQAIISNKAKEAQHLELLADIRHKQGHWTEAIEFYKQCLDVLHQLGNQAKKAFILYQMGAVFCDQGDRTEAIQCYEQSLALARQVKNPKIEGWSLNNLGSVYNEQQQWTQAERCYDESLAIARQMGEREMEADILHAIGCNYSDQKRWAETIPYFEQDLEIRRELGESSKEVIILSSLSQLYSMIGNEAKAKILRQEARAALNKIDPNSPEAEEVKQTAKRLHVDSDT